MKAQAALIEDQELTPSARILQDLHTTDSGFFHYALDAARNNRQYFASLEVSGENQLALFDEEATRSLERQAEIEASDDITLDEYLQRYFSA